MCIYWHINTYHICHNLHESIIHYNTFRMRNVNDMFAVCVDLWMIFKVDLHLWAWSPPGDVARRDEKDWIGGQTIWRGHQSHVRDFLHPYPSLGSSRSHFLLRDGNFSRSNWKQGLGQERMTSHPRRSLRRDEVHVFGCVHCVLGFFCISFPAIFATRGL